MPIDTLFERCYTFSVSEAIDARLEKKIDYLLQQMGKYMKLQWKVLYIMFFIMGGIMLFGSLGFFVAPSDQEKVTVQNTKLFTAEITKIQPLPYYSLSVDGINATIGIRDAEMVVDFDTLAELVVGDEITFRIHKNAVPNLTLMSEFIAVVALKIGDKDIITLDSTNKYLSETELDYVGGIVMIVFGIGFIGAGVAFLKVHKRKVKELQELAGLTEKITPLL